MSEVACLRCGGHLDTDGACANCGPFGTLRHATRTPAPGSFVLSATPSAPALTPQGCPSLADETRALEADAAEVDEAAEAWSIRGLLAPPVNADELGWIGLYRVLKVLGMGGMGVVFKAEDVSLNRVTALKVMLPVVAAKPANRKRFLREARTAAALRHENVITVYNVGEERGIPYLVMEFLEGETLEERLAREGRLPVGEVLRIGAQTARGLAAAHKVGLVHRDIKPANIWLEGDGGRVKILDFGLARATEDDSHLTKTGTIMGTPAYMAPEQARGDPVDSRTDLFSLGSVLYRTCTGHPAFRGADTLTVLTSLATENPLPMYRWGVSVPVALENLILSLLSKSPDGRPASAEAVVASIERIKRDEESGEIFTFDLAELHVDDDTELADDEPEAPPPAGVPRLPLVRMADLVGRTLGRFTLEEVLGQGHCGVVFRARDRDRGQVVALKVLSPDFPHNKKELQRFSEVLTTAMAMPPHPNLVTVRGAGRNSDYCWIALEPVDGESLWPTVQRLDPTTAWGWKRAFRLATHIAQALHHLRGPRITHGNITPHNILVRRADDRFMLNDAVLAKVLQKSVLYHGTLERKLEDELPYLSPEQADGGTTFVDYICDLYSLGVVVYLLLTGHLPYLGRTSEETLDLIRGGALKPPSRYKRGIPRDFERALIKMLARQQVDRYQSPAELLESLNKIAILNRIPS